MVSATTTKDLVLDHVRQYLDPIPSNRRHVIKISTKALHSSLKDKFKSVASYTITPSLLHDWCCNNLKEFKFYFESQHGNKGKRNAAKNKNQNGHSSSSPSETTCRVENTTQVSQQPAAAIPVTLPAGVRCRGIGLPSASSPVLLMSPQQHSKILMDFQNIQKEYQVLLKECDHLKRRSTSPEQHPSPQPGPFDSSIDLQEEQRTIQPQSGSSGLSEGWSNTHTRPLKRKRTTLPSPTPYSEERQIIVSRNVSSTNDRDLTKDMSTTTVNGIPLQKIHLKDLSPSSGTVHKLLHTTLTLSGIQKEASMVPSSVETPVRITIESNLNGHSPSGEMSLQNNCSGQQQMQDFHFHSFLDVPLSSFSKDGQVNIPLGCFSTPQTLRIWASSNTTPRSNSVYFQVTEENRSEVEASCSEESSPLELSPSHDEFDFNFADPALTDLDMMDIFESRDMSDQDFFSHCSNSVRASSQNHDRTDHQSEFIQDKHFNCTDERSCSETITSTILSAQNTDEFAVLNTSQTTPHVGQRVAILIGNDNYDSLPTLNTSLRDLSKMQQTLQKNGYTVHKIENCTRSGTLSTLQSIKRFYEQQAAADPVDEVVVLYSGHGVDGKICTVDFTDTSGLTSDATVDFEEVIRQLPSCEHAVLAFDCCDSGSVHQLKEKLHKIASNLPKNVHVLSSVSEQGKLSLECDENGGLLTGSLLKSLALKSGERVSLQELVSSMTSCYDGRLRAIGIHQNSDYYPQASQLVGQKTYHFLL